MSSVKSGVNWFSVQDMNQTWVRLQSKLLFFLTKAIKLKYVIFVNQFPPKEKLLKNGQTVSSLNKGKNSLARGAKLLSAYI